jgi:hypothetical protein
MDEETLSKRGEFIQRHWPLIVVLVIALVPAVWYLVDLMYKERLQTAEERLKLSEDRRLFVEDKLRAGVGEPARTESTGHAATTATKPATSGSPQSPERGSYPRLENLAQPTQDDVRKLAEYYDLMRTWSVNPQLRFKTGDISYWHEQGLSARDLDREFESRRLVLLRAERMKQIIPSQGDLSQAAELLQSQMKDSVGGSRPTNQ